jgi:hypothetical protein
MTVLGSVVGVAAIIAVVAIIAITHKSGNSVAGDRASAPAAVVQAVTNVSDATLSSVGKGDVLTQPAAVSGESPLASGGKPELLYIGAEFCPYCAVERWSLAVALSKFGTLSKLGVVNAATDDGNYASLDFYKSSYTSKYLTFTAVENEDRDQKSLETLTDDQKALWYKLDGNSPGFPFVSFGNKLAYTKTPPIEPSVLGTLTQAQVAKQLDDPSSKVAKAVDGGANSDIAAICTMTDNQPASVCSSTTITGLQKTIGG